METWDTVVLSSLKHIITQTQDFEGQRPWFSSKTPFDIFQQLFESVCLCACACVCAGEEQHTQDALSWWVDFESSTGDCPVQTIIWKELCFWAFLTKRPPGDVDEPTQGKYKSKKWPEWGIAEWNVLTACSENAVEKFFPPFPLTF